MRAWKNQPREEGLVWVVKLDSTKFGLNPWIAYLSCSEGGVVGGRDLDRLACFRVSGLVCRYVSDVEGAEAREPYMLTAGKAV